MNQNDSLTLKNYKLPLKAIPKTEGYGYFGAVMVTTDGKGIQCHVCGEVYADLSGHARAKHKLLVKEYQEKFDLSRNTALISESERYRRKEETLKWIRSMTPEEYQETQRKALENYHKWRKANPPQKFKERLESKNKKGSCP